MPRLLHTYNKAIKGSQVKDSVKGRGSRPSLFVKVVCLHPVTLSKRGSGKGVFFRTFQNISAQDLQNTSGQLEKHYILVKTVSIRLITKRGMQIVFLGSKLGGFGNISMETFNSLPFEPVKKQLFLK